MNAKLLLKSLFFKIAFVVLGVTFFESCNKNDTTKNTIFTDNVKEEKEAYFFIATVNVSKKMISKSQIAQQKCSDSTIQDVSKKIEIHQNQLLQEVTKLANRKLIIITEINATHKRDLYDLIDADEISFNQAYLNSIQESLHEEINLLESISKETNDQTILKLVLQYLPEQYQFLRETEKIKKVII